MPPMERSEIGTLEKIPIWPTNASTVNRRRRPLRSRTVDTLLHILSVCYADSSHITQNSDKDDTHVGSIIIDDLPSTCTNIKSTDSEHQEETNVDETRVILGTQEESLDLSSPHLDTNKDVEEGEISGEFTNLVPEDDDVESMDKTGSEEHEDFTGINSGFEKNNSLTLTKRNLVDYSEIALHGKSTVSANNLINNATKNQDFGFPIKDNGAQNNKKRQRSCNDEKRTNKKAKKSVDQSTCPEGLTKTGENPEDASSNKDADTKKKEKRVLTAERKAKKKRKEKIKRAEKNRKLGVKRLKLQPMIKQKKIIYCRHYINGRCHEGENCKFSHDTTPLTKSKPCCHFARHSCMKGDECPFDHQLSKYPCNNYLSKGFCPRGSDCMFSHEAQPSEASLNPLNESTSVQVQPPKGVTFISREKIDTKPKSSPQPPKGISFLSQEKLPVEAQSSPKVNSEREMTKTPPEVPRGINFLSFGKKHSDGGFGFTFKIGKSPLSKAEGIIVNVDDGVKVVKQIDNNEKIRTNSESKPMHVLPFLSSASRRTLESTLAFAAKFDSGVKGI